MSLSLPIFDGKGTPFIYLPQNNTPFMYLLNKWHPIHIPTSNVLQEILKGPFNAGMPVFPALFYTSTHEILAILQLMKSLPFKGEQGCCRGETARLPPMWPGFDSRTWHHMRVEFVVGSLLAPRGFSPGTPVFPSSQKPTFPNSNSIQNGRRRTTFWMCYH